ncbi:DNA-protecting protein DprA [Acinetobacter nectaris]|uniref:DNA-processing protein DprA n=2 Tax=Acinetobacter nectaris TaxID=1219382 RepID=UPI001F02D5DB|nr:DNA-processing protein DprA [Acinetobacter nectaris]MCF9000307.1 DNA-protecting protein DprA [Acinetobacter nectaris]
MQQPISENQAAIITLWYLVQHSLSTYYKLTDFFGHARNAITPANIAKWPLLKIHSSHIKRANKLNDAETQKILNLIFQSINTHCDFICTIDDDLYPTMLQPYNDKPPILFGQGNTALLNDPSIAIIGSRKSSKLGEKNSYDFSYYFAEKGYVVISGLAEGIDQAAHYGAVSHQKTIAVMATGIDITYPKHHDNLRRQILKNSGTIITEFLPQTKPLQFNFPRRNRLVSGMSISVVVIEAGLHSGSLGTAKIAAEQGKDVFATPGYIHDPLYEGCHELIREGATLIFHPEQVIEDSHFAFVIPNHQTTSIDEKDSTIPSHLKKLYNDLSWHAQGIDELSEKVTTPIAQLTAELMELELLGLCIHQSGKYLRG